MKYEKPEAVVLASAMDAVRSTDKVHQIVQELGSPGSVYAATKNAYEADE
jgi:hypothetical protein